MLGIKLGQKLCVECISEEEWYNKAVFIRGDEVAAVIGDAYKVNINITNVYDRIFS